MKQSTATRTTGGRVPESVLRQIVDLARLAPSIHNTQPWFWRVGPDSLELWADPTRTLPVADPVGRNLVISCGTALHHALVAARALGLETEVEHLPEEAEPDLMARVQLSPGLPDPQAEEHLASIRDRITDRRRFTSWPVPETRVTKLGKAAAHWGAEAVPITDPSLRLKLELLLERARLTQSHDAAYLNETGQWIDRSTTDGIPHEAIPSLRGRVGERPHRFDQDAFAERSTQVVESTDGLLVVATEEDNRLAWLCAGEALSALWLRATHEGLSVVPLSQVVEDPGTRRSLRELLPTRRTEPQVLARIGWQEISRSVLPRTPRRPLDDVIRP